MNYDNCKFKVHSVSKIKDKAMVFGVVSCGGGFVYKPGMTIAGVKTKDAIMPRKTDDKGNIIKNYWGFVLEDSQDIFSFKEGVEVGFE